MNFPFESIANLRGCFSVGVLPTYVSFPVAPSTLSVPIELHSSRDHALHRCGSVRPTPDRRLNEAGINPD